MEVRIWQLNCKINADSRIAKAQSVADSINKDGGSAIAVAGDMLDAEYLKTLVKKAAEFGNGKIHIIVNNAGYIPISKSAFYLC
jgi:3-oxoacyl-[acyl-carrier protein] reductase